ncbi:DUF1801 domain-containing protein [Melittangium boletus]|uniref:DUF1801 domain-containing protein n=1 Tax=Melittangium boletus TaxID=83453 RepID=UPI003DA53650
MHAFLQALAHPLQTEAKALRALILEVSPDVLEEIKWNAPSFRTTEHFATFNLRSREHLRLVLHLGAKVKATAKTGIQVADPSGLVEWLAPDRGLVTVRDAKDFQRQREALQTLLREWIRWV